MSRHRGAKHSRRYGRLGSISLLSPRVAFYPCAMALPCGCHRVTKTDFRLCSGCPPRSQACFCLCTHRLISDQPEQTFARLRYNLGGDHPSQTAHHALSPALVQERGLDIKNTSGWYFTDRSMRTKIRTSKRPTYPTQMCPNANTKLQ